MEDKNCNDFIQECYEFFERMSRKYDDIIEIDSLRIDIKRAENKRIPIFDETHLIIQKSHIMEVCVFKKDEKLKAKQQKT